MDVMGQTLITNVAGAVNKGSTPGTAIPLASTSGADQVGVIVSGWIASAGTAGTVNFQWSQDVPILDDTSVEAGSIMIAHKL